jgi:hypothetical protein
MIRRVLVIAGLIFFASAGRADHLADRLKASGKPEMTLAGIRLTERTRLKDVIRLYGKPTRMKAWESSDPGFSSSYDYYWVKRALNLRVVVERLPGLESVGSIEVNEGTGGKIGRTGKGLRIGQSLNDLRRLYGHRYSLRDIPKLKIHDVMLQWRHKEYSLVATLDRHNRITGLSLCAPE